MKVHYVIVGQGLAGSILAWQLMQHEQSVLIVDNAKGNSASRVAAGLINPITGQRLVKSNDVDTCLSTSISFYRKLEAVFKRQFYFPLPMIRLFRSQAEIDRYKNRCKDHTYQPYMGEYFQSGQREEFTNDSMGGFVQHQTGYLDIKTLLSTLRTYFEEHNAYCGTTLNYSDLIIDNGHIRWGDFQASSIIFCEGAHAVDNPWFRWLPFQLSKGEIISLKTDQRLPNTMLNDGYWLLPVTDDRARVGATYEWEWQDEKPSSKAHTVLMDACSRLTGMEEGWSVIDHKAGIRPTTKDKNPFIGNHPTVESLSILNGFGSKGSMLIPYYASRLVEFLLRGTSIPKQADIRRFEGGISMVTLAKRFLSEAVKPGDTVVDATVGNGYDTEFLARCVGPDGKVIGFDIQENAIAKTSERLSRMSLHERLKLYNVDHQELAQYVDRTSHGNIAAVSFNLGYLPGALKAIKTQTVSTISALQQAIELIRPGGIITVICYVGHQGGGQETNRVQEFLAHLNRPNLSIKTISSDNKKDDAPQLVVVTKIND